MEFRKIGVLGASTMGAGLVQHIANCGFEVVFRARKQTSVDSALKYIEGQYDFMLSRGWLEEGKKEETFLNYGLLFSLFYYFCIIYMYIG